MSQYQPSVSLHQQDGGMSLQAFAALYGMTGKAMRKYVITGRVVGARQDARSKKWTIYPPAKLVDKSGDVMKRREPAAARGKFPPPAGVACAPPAGFSTGSVEAVDVGTSPHGLSADRLQPAQETREVSDNRPPAKRGFNAFEGGADRGDRHAENVYRDPETRRVLEVLREVAARQFREGLHYLRLDAREFAQLYAALDNDRSRVRKLVGKGVLPVGLLRCSDSVWQKMQAMSREGRLL